MNLHSAPDESDSSHKMAHNLSGTTKEGASHAFLPKAKRELIPPSPSMDPDDTDPTFVDQLWNLVVRTKNVHLDAAEDGDLSAEKAHIPQPTSGSGDSPDFCYILCPVKDISNAYCHAKYGYIDIWSIRHWLLHCPSSSVIVLWILKT